MAKPAVEKKPLSFNVAPEMAVTSPAPIPSPPAKKPAAPSEMKQVGARVDAASYRQLKARAALEGSTVQELVGRAISDFLARG